MSEKKDAASVSGLSCLACRDTPLESLFAPLYARIEEHAIAFQAATLPSLVEVASTHDKHDVLNDSFLRRLSAAEQREAAAAKKAREAEERKRDQMPDARKLVRESVHAQRVMALDPLPIEGVQHGLSFSLKSLACGEQASLEQRALEKLNRKLNPEELELKKQRVRRIDGGGEEAARFRQLRQGL